MKLVSLEYSQHLGGPNEWRLEGLTLGPANLLVGKNASGKTRVLNVISGLAKLLTGTFRVGHGSFDARFEHEGKTVRYILHIEETVVRKEELTTADGVVLKRGPGGVGKIRAEQAGTEMDFQTPEDQLAAVARRDSIQHRFFEPLTSWGRNLYHYQFGSSLGKDKLAVLGKEDNGPVSGDGATEDPDKVVAIFGRGKKQLGEKFTNSIITDMGQIGYEIDKIDVCPPVSITIRGGPGEPMGLYVKETTLRAITDQPDMSQGMFRALSIIIQMNYSVMAKQPSCFLIDDIGEGLDFERSCLLIDVLMKKAGESGTQLVMATNDRFVMNRVPLDVWSVLDRSPGVCRVYNYSNSKEVFEDFKFTGLNNFDFLATDFIREREGAE
jgi:energy-coupling factor transporter ATP-binding protein EcfA2